MPRLEETIKRRFAPSKKILRMAFPDEETLAFWKVTADDPHEYADRIARFSRALGKDATRNAFRSPERRRRDVVPTVQSRLTKPLGKLLMMPSHPGNKEGL